MNKYLFASFGSLLMTALLFAFVLVFPLGSVTVSNTASTINVSAGAAE